ncbi:ABC transporter ATP-binding protein/permease [Acholeplasma sp. OttesenSCG-928-E16]|nr:ABC transporter ATP-binding protein/permease [Acholeplasma sp. OttesenSCG-928-E16]
MHDEDFKQEKINILTWKKIFSVIKQSKWHLIWMIIFAILLAILDVILPLLNEFALSTFFGEDPNFKAVPWFIAAYVLVIAIFGIAVWGFIKKAGIIEAESSYILRKDAFANLQKLPFSYYDKTAHGWLMARMTSDARKLSDIISWGLVDIIWALFLMVTILITMFVRNWILALIVLASIPIMVIVSVIFSKLILKNYRKARKYNSEVTAKYNESFHGAKTTKSLNIEKPNLLEFEHNASMLKSSSIRAVISSSLFTSVLLAVSFISVAVVTYFGADQFYSGIITDVALIYLFTDLTFRFFDPLMVISRTFSNLQQAQASAERIIGLIEEKPDLDDEVAVKEKYGDLFNDNKENWEDLRGDIEFKNVTFYYKEGETILDNFNIKIKAGQNVALVGHTGSGKTTIVNLIARFYEPKNGQILLDGKDYKERSIHWLHSKLGYVLQSPFLFSTTIKENIRYGRLEATDQEIYDAAKAIGADDFIVKLEKGYDTNVGEGGNLLSIGQKQLISFARAILANPQILILDEATSSIDSEAEQIIQDATSTLLKGRTSLVVAHRLSTIVDADLIIMLDMGKIQEMGTHKELIEKRGAYFELYKNQFFQEKEAEMIKSLN